MSPVVTETCGEKWYDVFIAFFPCWNKSLIAGYWKLRFKDSS